MRDVALQLLEFFLGENLHKVVDVQEDPIEVDAVDCRWEEADHPPETLNARKQTTVGFRYTACHFNGQARSAGARRATRRRLPS